MLAGRSTLLAHICTYIANGIATIHIAAIPVALNRGRQSASGILLKTVLLQVKPNKIQSFRTVVDIIDGNAAFDGVGIFIQFRTNYVISRILRVFRPALCRGCSLGRSLAIGKFVIDILIAFKALLTIGTMDRG